LPTIQTNGVPQPEFARRKGIDSSGATFDELFYAEKKWSCVFCRPGKEPGKKRRTEIIFGGRLRSGLAPKITMGAPEKKTHFAPFVV